MTLSRRARPLARLTLLFALLASGANAWSIAYCALRDPVAAIQSIYPDYSSYRTIVGTVGKPVRDALQRELPFPVYFDEFGRHSLYVVAAQGKPRGLIHARTEMGQWGLDEIVWALDLDLRIHDFRFQRTRDPARRIIEREEFRALLRGKSASELLALLSDGELSEAAASNLPPKARPLAGSLIRSAAKVIIVTREVWDHDLAAIQADTIAAKAFPGTAGLQIEPYAHEDQIRVLEAHRAANRGAMTQPSTFRAFAVADDNGQPIGTLLRTRFEGDQITEQLWWTVVGEDDVVSVLSAPQPISNVTRDSIGALDRSVEDLQQCATPGEAALLEVKLIARELHGTATLPGARGS
jgi:hypothetical protein